MRKAGIVFWLGAFSALGGAPVFGGEFEDYRDRQNFDWLKVSVKPWFSGGGGRFDISFPLAPPLSKNDIGTGSTLEFNEDLTLMYLFSAEVRPLDWLSFDAQYATGEIDGGTELDHDWLNVAPRFQVFFPGTGHLYRGPVDHQDMSLSQAKLSGSSHYLSTNVYFRVLRWKTELLEADHALDIFSGYSWFKNQYRIRDGVQQICTGDIVPCPPVGTSFVGLDSKYNYRWEGFRLGLREEVKLSDQFLLFGTFAYLPYVQYEGAGYWNLRNDLRQGEPSFIHGAWGNAQEFSVTVEWSATRTIALQGGYMWLRYRASRGVDTTYFSDGTNAQVDLDNVETDRRGYFLGVAYKFGKGHARRPVVEDPMISDR